MIGGAMGIAENKAVVQRLFDEVWNGGVVDELYAADHVADYRPSAPLLPIPPTGKRLEFDEMLLLTFDASGQVVHQRGVVDNLAGLRQVGVMPTPTASS